MAQPRRSRAARQSRRRVPLAARVVDVYQRLSHRWDAGRPCVLIERDWLDRFRALVPAGSGVLDVGCGAGEPIAGTLIRKGYRVTGLDAAPAMIARCRKRFPAQAWRVGDMRTMHLGRRFDGIIAWDSFFHLPPASQRGMFCRFADHAASGAPLLFTSGPHFGEPIGRVGGEPIYHASLDEADYRRLLDDAGFDVVAYVPEDPACDGHTVWLAKRR
ncbi:MAG: class I SAM-dependent methyltransferase [Pseudomonadota bacterium]